MTMHLPRSFMLIAGEPSGDRLGAELVEALKLNPALSAQPFPPVFFGAGGAQMKSAGVEVVLDLTQHTVFGFTEALKQYPKFKRFFNRLLQLAQKRQPDAIILIDFAGLNRRFARAVKACIRTRLGEFRNWKPKLIYYVSPQVWASREARAYALAEDIDLLLSIFPFEKAWYKARVPKMRVEFVGHPLVDRYKETLRNENQRIEANQRKSAQDDWHQSNSSRAPLMLLLPGSRMREIEAHLPVMLDALARINSEQRLRARIVLPNHELIEWARQRTHPSRELEIQSDDIAESLLEADLAIASSGTVTMECAYFRLPTVVIYKTSWITYQIASRIVRVRSIAMPNILGDESIFPEFIQHDATPENISRAALDILTNPARRDTIQRQLCKVIDSLGKPGASGRAAEAIMRLWISPKACSS